MANDNSNRNNPVGMFFYALDEERNSQIGTMLGVDEQSGLISVLGPGPIRGPVQFGV